MTVEQWMRENIPKGKTTLSVDAVEILIRIAWEEARKSEQNRLSQSKYDDDTY